MKEKVIVLVPEAPAPVAENAAPKPKPLPAGDLRVGLLDNGKGNADHLLRFVFEGLNAETKISSSVSLRKRSVSLAADQPIIERLAAEADLVITAKAD